MCISTDLCTLQWIIWRLHMYWLYCFMCANEPLDSQAGFSRHVPKDGQNLFKTSAREGIILLNCRCRMHMRNCGELFDHNQIDLVIPARFTPRAAVCAIWVTFTGCLASAQPFWQLRAVITLLKSYSLPITYHQQIIRFHSVSSFSIHVLYTAPAQLSSIMHVFRRRFHAPGMRLYTLLIEILFQM